MPQTVNPAASMSTRNRFRIDSSMMRSIIGSPLSLGLQGLDFFQRLPRVRSCFLFTSSAAEEDGLAVEDYLERDSHFAEPVIRQDCAKLLRLGDEPVFGSQFCQRSFDVLFFLGWSRWSYGCGFGHICLRASATAKINGACGRIETRFGVDQERP